MKTIGLLSDTHSYLDDAVFKHFDQCDEIWHAGDFGAGVADPILAKEIGFPTDIVSWSTILNKCEFIAVRGVFSKSLIETKEWSVHNEVNILHDPALFFAKKNLILKTKTKTI